MRFFKVRIGTKLGATAGLGVVLVIGMMVNEQLSSALLFDSKRAADLEQAVIKDVTAAGTSLRRMQLAVRDIGLAVTQDEIKRANDAARAEATSGLQALDQGIERVARAGDKERLGRVATLVESYRNA